MNCIDGQRKASSVSIRSTQTAAIMMVFAITSVSWAEDKKAEQDGPAAGHSFHGESFNQGPRQAAYLMNG